MKHKCGLITFILMLLLSTNITASPMLEHPIYSDKPIIIMGEDLTLLTNFGESEQYQLEYQPRLINNKMYVPIEFFHILFPDSNPTEMLSQVRNTAYDDGTNVVFFSKDSEFVEVFDGEFANHIYCLDYPTYFDKEVNMLYVPIYDVLSKIEVYSAYKLEWDNQLKTLTITCDPKLTTYTVPEDQEVH